MENDLLEILVSLTPEEGRYDSLLKAADSHWMVSDGFQQQLNFKSRSQEGTRRSSWTEAEKRFCYY